MSNLPALSASAPTIFTFQNGKPHAVRIHTDDQGEPLFHVGDLCDLLEYVNARDALRRHVETDDVVKRDVIDRLGRTQSANFISEPGMWSLVFGSHAPMAKKIKRWMSSEVLPAIRKTGRYIAPAAPIPDVVHETLGHADMANLTRMVWLICGRPAHNQAWVQAVWYRLRQVCQCPAPNRFQVRHLPLLAAEVKRLAEVSLAFTDLVSTAERTLIARVIRQGEDEAPLLADLARQVQAQATETRVELHKHLQRWVDMELTPLTERRQTRYLGSAEFGEPA